MAMRSLLPRIPAAVLHSPSPPCLGAVQAISPEMTSRFMGTRSQGEEHHLKTFDAEKMMVRLRESIKLMHEEAMNDQQMIRKQLMESDEDIRRQLVEVKRSLNNMRRVASACVAAAVGVPLFIILKSKDQT
ncbi:hypothetical protein U9M48_012496 [Paspalum notatum var. saurae]|uniref:Uncharacterized protein n=1 Tax=Paspalum notatum var. saurae TaxID=547442 RepID=A0AAQ3SYD9_PASNO